MALNRLEADLSIISKLGTNPGIDDGLSEEQLKAKFDEAANIIKDFINNYLILQFENVVDVEAMLKDILDVTLSKDNKAANAASTGEAIRGLRSFFDKVVHGGDYVLESGDCLAAEISGYSAIRIKGGEGVMQGNLFALNIGAYEDVELLDGTYGMYRNDLIVVRCTKDSTNALNYALVGLTGTNASGDPVDPEYNQSDINAAGTVRDFPLYRVKFNGVDIEKLEPLFVAEKPVYSLRNAFGYVVVSLPVSGWTADGKAFVQTVNVPGMTAAWKVGKITIVSNETDEEDEAMGEAAACITKASTGAGTITFRCASDKPEADMNLEVHGAMEVITDG